MARIPLDFRGKQDGGCYLAHRPIAVDSHQRSIYQTSPRLCHFLRGRLVSETHDRRHRRWVVSPLNHSARTLNHPLGYDRKVGNARSAEDATVTLNFRRQSHRLRVVIRELDRGTVINFAQFAYKTHRVKALVTSRIAVPKIVRKQSPPASTEANAPFRLPSRLIQKIGRPAKLGRRSSSAKPSTKIRMQRKDRIDIK